MSTPRYDINEEPTCRELFKLSLKERFLKIILEGNLNSINCLQELFDKNPERFLTINLDFQGIPLMKNSCLTYLCLMDILFYTLLQKKETIMFLNTC